MNTPRDGKERQMNPEVEAIQPQKPNSANNAHASLITLHPVADNSSKQ
jgi:hypothetical protein